MKKFAPYLILFLLAVLAWDALFDNGMSFTIDGDEFHGPFGTVIGLLVAGGGLLIGVIALVFAALVVAVVFAGLGVIAVAGLLLAAVVVVACVAPFLLPLLIPVAIIWYLLSRDRKHRIDHPVHASAQATQPAASQSA